MDLQVLLQTSITNLFCLIILLILLFGLILNKKNNDEVSKKFAILVLCCSFFSLVTLLSDILEYTLQVDILVYLVDILTFLTIDLTVVAFMFYIRALIGNNKLICKPLLSIILFTSATRSLLTLILFFSGNLFSVVDHIYYENDLAIIPYIMSFVIMLEFIIFIILNKRNFTKRQFIVILLYELLPIAPIIIEYYTGLYTLTNISLTASSLIIYVLIQTTRINESITRETILKEITSKDSLTKINNRRSYYDAVNNLKPNENVGVIFCDINGLKYTNDHFGHLAGDQLICKFANMLKEYFGQSNVFRISGDEFVVLLPKTQRDILENNIKIFHEAIEREKSIAAVGYSYGTTQCFDKLIHEAEDYMYKDKENSKVPKR